MTLTTLTTLTRWSEEEMREIPVEPPVRQGRGLAQGLRAEVSGRNMVRAREHSHELTRSLSPGVVYAPEHGTHGNFIEASYRRILDRPEWARRLLKAHSGKRQARAAGPQEQVREWRELDAATSSDALLMNVFCYPRLLTRSPLCALLGVDANVVPEFGYQPRIPLQRGLFDRTEIDMRLGRLLVEAKLTESDFQFAPVRLLERYPCFEQVFEREQLEITRRGIRSYQLIRGVLAAHAEEGLFCVFIDARRTDLVEEWYAVVRAVRSFQLQARLRLLTWQEIASALPVPLRRFLQEKYGIQATG